MTHSFFDFKVLTFDWETGIWGATKEVERPPTDFLFFSMMEMATAVTAAFGNQ